MADVPSNLIPTRVTQLPIAPVADENSLMMIVYQGNNYQIRVGDLLSVAGVPITRQVIAGTGLTGGGQLSSNVTLSVAPGGIGNTQLSATGVTPGTYGNSTNIPVFTVDAKGRVTAASSIPVSVSGFVPETRQVIAGTGLTGGGPLNSNVTLSASLSNSTPLPGDNAGAPGVSTSMSRADHRHPAVDLTDADEVDGILGLSHGGTARSLVMQPGAIIWSGADGLYVSAPGTLGQVLVSGGTGAPTWGSSVILAPTPANYVFAGPASGPNTDPVFRLLVNNDLPVNIISKAITSSTINSTVIGGTTPAAVTGTTVTATSQFNGSGAGLTSIPNSALNNSSVTFNGVSVALGASGTITANTTNALTAGTGLQLDSGTTFNGSAAKTISIDSSVVTLTGTQTLTGKTMSGASNTFSNIPNAALSNSTVTFNGVSVALGGSATITANTTNSLTFNSSGTGAASGTAFNGGTAYTISYNTVGASPLAGSASLTTVGTVTSGTWNATPIANSYLANSAVTVGTTAISLGSSSLTLGGLTSVTVTQDPTQPLQLATKQYVDAVTESLHIHAACAAATPASLASITGGTVTYNNGTAGVGATLTLSVPLTVLDGYTLQNGNRVLVKNESNQAYNGIYTWATGGTVLTRATDFDTTTEIASGDYTFVTYGTLYASTGWVQTNPTTVIGTSPIAFVQFSGAGTYTAGTGLTLTGTQFFITNTGVSAASYGTASSVPTIAVNAQGQITSASNTAIAINGNQITSGTVGSAYISGSYTGITGVGTLTAGTWNASAISDTYLSTISTAGKVANSATTATSANTASAIVARDASGNFSAGTITAALSGNATSATNLAGGAASQIPYQTGAGATTFLANGTAGQLLKSNGASAPSWAGVDGGTF